MENYNKDLNFDKFKGVDISGIKFEKVEDFDEEKIESKEDIQIDPNKVSSKDLSNQNFENDLDFSGIDVSDLDNKIKK